MLRTIICSAIFVTVLAFCSASARAQEPVSGSLSGTGTLTPVSPGTTTVSGGVLQLGNPLNVTPQTGTVQFNVQSAPLNLVPASGTVTLGAIATAPAKTPTAPATAKPFYIITEGAGLGDSVRSVNCTGNETVLDAVSMINGISQVSDSRKIWIARPGPKGKSTTLEVNWDEISRRGINTTNYTLQPGDRLVLGEDALIKQGNLISKKTAPIERLMGITSLTTSVVSSLGTSPGGGEVIKDLVRKGSLSDDEEVKQFVLGMIRIQEAESKKTAAKPAAERKPAP